MIAGGAGRRRRIAVLAVLAITASLVSALIPAATRAGGSVCINTGVNLDIRVDSNGQLIVQDEPGYATRLSVNYSSDDIYEARGARTRGPHFDSGNYQCLQSRKIRASQVKSILLDLGDQDDEGEVFNVFAPTKVPATVLGGSGSDSLEGGYGNDFLDGGPGTDSDEYDGSKGIDTVSLAAASSAVNVDLSNTQDQNTGGAGLESLRDVENLTGSAHNDVLQGDGEDNVLDGAAGIDTVSYSNARAGVAANLAQMDSQDTRGEGNDRLSNFENLTGGPGNDTLTGNARNNILDGASGTDTASYSSAAGPITANLATGQATGAGSDTLSGFENLTGGPGNDTLTGNAQNNILNGASGTDTASYASATAGITATLSLTGAQDTKGAGSDTLSGFENLTGGSYGDTLQGNAADNKLAGGSGSDTASYAAASSGVTADLSQTGPQNTKAAGTDTLASLEDLAGSAHDDVLTGNSAINRISGSGGSDRLQGSGGNDFIDGGHGSDPEVYGGTGDDQLFDTGGGDDVLLGQGGNDTLSGGPGADRMSGGTDTDTALYWDKTGSISVSLDDQTNDGNVSDTSGNLQDNVTADTENVTGGSGDDTLIGNGNPNVLDGGYGSDSLDGSGGDDFLKAKDGLTDRLLSCGLGNDKVLADPLPSDPLAIFASVPACETVTR